MLLERGLFDEGRDLSESHTQLLATGATRDVPHGEHAQLTPGIGVFENRGKREHCGAGDTKSLPSERRLQHRPRGNPGLSGLLHFTNYRHD